MHSQLFEVQSTLQSKGILISFSGRLSQGLIEEYGEAVKKYLEADDRPKNQVYHIFSIFIEQTQNIKNYCTRKQSGNYSDQIEQSCIVTIGKSEQGSFICSGNLVENQDLETLIGQIDELSTCDKDNLKKKYKEKLKQELPEGSLSAGIGLIEIARKASYPLEYSVTRLNDHLSFFTLQAVV
ncbi:hypothetical protein D3C73_550120 [compost metagenome]